MLGISTSVAVISIGQLLDRVAFPLNYRIMFIAMSLGGLISYYYSSHHFDSAHHSPQIGISKISQRTIQ